MDLKVKSSNTSQISREDAPAQTVKESTNHVSAPLNVFQCRSRGQGLQVIAASFVRFTRRRIHRLKVKTRAAL